MFFYNGCTKSDRCYGRYITKRMIRQSHFHSETPTHVGNGLQVGFVRVGRIVTCALQQDEYLGVIQQTEFTNIEIKRTKVIELPDDVLHEYLSESDIANFKKKNIGIFSITVVGYKK